MAEAQIVVDLETSLQHELNKLWGNTNEEENITIFRIPHNISQSKKNLFEPSVISIGPFHRGKEHLRALEKQKLRFLRDFLSHGDHISLNLCIGEMRLLETRTRRCFSETFDALDSNAFIEMMLLDGCFLLEYFLNDLRGLNYSFEVGWNSNFIQHDLVLLENQIPFYIVEKLYEIGNSNQEVPIEIFVKYIASVFLAGIVTKDYILSIFIPYAMPDPPAEIHHLVHLYYHYLVPNPKKPVVWSSKLFRKYTGNLSSMVIPSATKLKEAGLMFRPKSNPKYILDVSFEYGILKIPQLEITDDTKPVFANLIAFEHSKHGKKDSPFTSFVIFLDNLVNTQNDVKILQKCGIVDNRLGSEEELAHFINQVTESNALSSDHYLKELYIEVNRFIESDWNKQRAKLVRDYFSGRWKGISVTAIILIVLTCVQSFFPVYTYFVSPSS